MKRLFSLVCVAMLTIAASAQITWNAKAGFGAATCWGDDTNNLKTHTVAKIGVGLEYPLNQNWSLMPSLEFALKGFEIKDPGLNTKLDLYYLQIPVVAAYRINLSDSWNMTLKAGPYVGYAVSDKFELIYNGQKQTGDAGVKKFDAGLDAGVDFEYHRFVFGAEYEIGFLDMYDMSIKNMAFYVTVGWKF